MNLFDLVNRPDRAVLIRKGEVVGRQGHVAGASRRYVQLSPGAMLRIKDAHELTVFRILSADFGWSALAHHRLRRSPEREGAGCASYMILLNL